MDIEWSTLGKHHGGSSFPQMNISCGGEIKINDKALMLLGKTKFVVAGYDREKHRLALKKIKGEDIGARVLTVISLKSRDYGSVSVRLFLRSINLLGVRLQMTCYIENDMLFADLPKDANPKEVKGE